MRPPTDASLPFSTSVASTASCNVLTDVTHKVAEDDIGRWDWHSCTKMKGAALWESSTGSRVSQAGTARTKRVRGT